MLQIVTDVVRATMVRTSRMEKTSAWLGTTWTSTCALIRNKLPAAWEGTGVTMVASCQLCGLEILRNLDRDGGLCGG